MFAEFKKILASFHILHLCKVSESNFQITLPNGSIFIFKGADDIEKLKSISGIDDAFLEEATEFTLDDYSQVNLRLRSKKPHNQITICFNPVSKSNWIYKRFFEGEPDLKNVTIVHTTYKDNKFLPQSYIDSLEEMIHSNPTYYKIYALGAFASLGKLIYTNWEKQEFDVYELMRKGYHARFGLDFGFSADPTAFIGFLVDRENKTLYFFDELYQKGMTNEDITDWIFERGYSKEIITADSSEPKSIMEIKRNGVRRIKSAKKGNDSVNWGISFSQGWKFVVHPRCVNFIEELENYEYQKDKKTNEYLNKPVDAFNHLMDAMRYGLEDEMPENRMNTMQKGALGI